MLCCDQRPVDAVQLRVPSISEDVKLSVRSSLSCVSVNEKCFKRYFAESESFSYWDHTENKHLLGKNCKNT